MTTYTITLRNGKYTVINGAVGLTFLRYGEAWPGAEDLRFSNVVIAMADRIQELEEAIKAVLDGSLTTTRLRNDDGMKDFDIEKLHQVAAWESFLRQALGQP